MSKERARRRAERVAEAASRAAERERRAAAEARRRARRSRLRGWLPRRTTTRSQSGLLAARRRRGMGLLAVGFLVIQFLTWVSTADWGLRVGVLLVSLLVLPLAAALTL